LVSFWLENCQLRRGFGGYRQARQAGVSEINFDKFAPTRVRVRYLIKIAGALVAFAALGSIVLVLRWHSGLQSALTIFGAILCASLVSTAFIAWSWMFHARAKTIVQKWAAEHKYLVLRFESPFHTGPFNFLTTGRGQIVFLVTIRDGTGLERKAWVRCGSYMGSVLFSDEIEVRWEAEQKPS
jgi:hypothetical protein